MQARSMRNYHLHQPLDDSPSALPWPTESPKALQRLANLTRNCAKATMQTPAEHQLRDPKQQATQPFFQANALRGPPPPTRRNNHGKKRAHPPLPPRSQNRQQEDDLPCLRTRPRLSSQPGRQPIKPPLQTQTRRPDRPSSHHKESHSLTCTQNCNRARESNNPTATTTRAPGSCARARSNTALRAGAQTAGCNGTANLNSINPAPQTRRRAMGWRSTAPTASDASPPRTRPTGAPSTAGKFPQNGVAASPPCPSKGPLTGKNSPSPSPPP